MATLCALACRAGLEGKRLVVDGHGAAIQSLESNLSLGLDDAEED